MIIHQFHLLFPHLQMIHQKLVVFMLREWKKSHGKECPRAKRKKIEMMTNREYCI